MKPKLMFSMYGVTSAMSAKCSLLHDAKKREWVPKTAANKKMRTLMSLKARKLALNTILMGQELFQPIDWQEFEPALF